MSKFSDCMSSLSMTNIEKKKVRNDLPTNIKVGDGYNFGCENVKGDDSTDYGSTMKKFFAVSVTAGIPYIGKPLSTFLRIFWPDPNDQELYQCLFDAEMCRAKNYIETVIWDAQADNMKNYILAFKKDMEDIDNQIADGNIDAAIATYQSLSQDLYSCQSQFIQEDDLQGALYTIGFFGAYVGFAVGFWLNENYNDLVSEEDRYSALVRAKDFVTTSNEYIKCIEANILDAFETTNDVNELHKAKMWLSLSGREVVNLVAKRLNQYNDYGSDHKDYSVDISDFPVAYIYDELAGGDTTKQGESGNQYVDTLWFAKPEDLPASLIEPGATKIDNTIDSIYKINATMMSGFDNPALYSFNRTNWRQYETGNRGDADFGKETNTTFTKNNGAYLSKVEVVKGPCNNQRCTMLNFYFSDGTKYIPHDYNGGVVKTFEREGYAIVGFAGFCTEVQTALETFTVTYLNIDDESKTSTLEIDIDDSSDTEKPTGDVLWIYPGPNFTGGRTEYIAQEASYAINDLPIGSVKYSMNPETWFGFIIYCDTPTGCYGIAEEENGQDWDYGEYSKVKYEDSTYNKVEWSPMSSKLIKKAKSLSKKGKGV